MAKVKVFFVDDTPTMPNYYVIRVNYEAFHYGPTVGSYNLIMARVMGISYADYLRLCRDEFGATIIGKNCYYPVAYFYKRGLVDKLCEELNARANLILFEYDHPDYPEHYNEVKKEEARRANHH